MAARTKKGHEGETRAIALLKAVLQFVAQIDDASHIHLEHAVDVSAGAARFDHALGNDLAHLRHGHKVAWNHWQVQGLGLGGVRVRPREPLRPVFDEIENVLLGDAAAGTSAIYFCEIHIVLAGELADERGRADVGSFFLFVLFFFFAERWRRAGEQGLR